MTFDEAAKIVLMRRKLHDLHEAASVQEWPAIDEQLGKLEPYRQQADDLVMKHTDGEFNQAAKALTVQIKPIDDAIADISKINDALTTAAQIINDIVKVVGFVAKIG